MKKGKKVFILKGLRVDSYGSYSTVNESVSTYATLEDAKDELALEARVFERVFGHEDRDEISVRIIDEETVKLSIARVFRETLEEIHEFRAFIREDRI